MWVIGIGFLERIVGSLPFWLLVVLFLGGMIKRSRSMRSELRRRR